MYRQITKGLVEMIKLDQAPVILILGMRQTGKSTLAKNLGTIYGKQVRFNFDLVSDQQEFVNQDRHTLKLFAQKYKDTLVIIDEVQKYPEATSMVKHLFDNERMKFVMTGSSELKIRQGMGDSLAGRVHEEKLYPLSISEINIQNDLLFDNNLQFNHYEENQVNLQKYLIYGSLPQLQNIKDDEKRPYLEDLVNTLISKDVLEISGMRKSTQVYLLAKMLALQIGQLVNFNELAANTELSRVSVYKFIDIFEQMGLIVRAKPISTNDREAISKATKIYFSDLGIRNALIGNFSDFNIRLDRGQLLENAVFMGIKRQASYQHRMVDLGFFRSASGSEIDIVEKEGYKERLLEIKTGKQKLLSKKNVQYVSLDTAQKYLY